MSIEGHKWSDRDIRIYENGTNQDAVMFIITCSETGFIMKNDAIAIARHFKLTESDLTGDE